jgi:hypothetical protein
VNEDDVRAQFVHAMSEAVVFLDEVIVRELNPTVTGEALDYLRSIAGAMTALAILTARQDPELYDAWKEDS